MNVVANKRGRIDPPTASGLGRLAGNYQIIDEIGSGGMSHVYRGRRLSDDQAVAVKVIRIENMAPDYEARLHREPEVQQGIGHDNIVRLHESFRQGEDFILVMEYVDGRSLAQMIHRETGPMSFERARGYFRQVLRGVEHLHRLGIVHRDVKPSNILIGWDDRVKLADFGIAKFAWEGDRTATRMGLGTPEYMSPEQVSGNGIDHRSDIYALGVTLFEMITARRPFAHEGATPMAYMQVIQDVLNKPLPDPRDYQPAIQPAVVEFIQRATAKNPQERYQSCSEMIAALEAIPEQEEAPPTVALGAMELDAAVAAPAALAASVPPPDTDATQVLPPMPQAVVAGEELEEGSSSYSTKRLVLLIGSIMLLLAGVVGFVMYQWGGDEVTTTSASMLSASDAREIADIAAGRYGNYLFGCRGDSLATLYAHEGVSYLGRAGVTRQAIAQEVARSCEQNASVQGVNIVVEEADPLSDVELETRWRLTSERRFKDGSIVRDSAVDLVRIALIDSSWVIVSQDRLWGRTHIFEATPSSASRTPSMQRSGTDVVEPPVETIIPDEETPREEPSSSSSAVSHTRTQSEPSGGYTAPRAEPRTDPRTEPSSEPTPDPSGGYHSEPRRQAPTPATPESTGAASGGAGATTPSEVGPVAPQYGPSEQKEEKSTSPENPGE